MRKERWEGGETMKEVKRQIYHVSNLALAGSTRPTWSGDSVSFPSKILFLIKYYFSGPVVARAGQVSLLLGFFGSLLFFFLLT